MNTQMKSRVLLAFTISIQFSFCPWKASERAAKDFIKKNCKIIFNMKNKTTAYKFAKMISDVYIEFLLPQLNPIKE